MARAACSSGTQGRLRRRSGAGLEELGSAPDGRRARGALQFRTVEEIYLYGGIFDPPRALDHTDALIDEALVDGFTGLRLTAELTRIPAPGEWQKIVWYEAMINERFARRPIATLCRYPRTLIPAERVRDLLRTHPTAIVRGESCENPFYERPEIVLSGDVRDAARLAVPPAARSAPHPPAPGGHALVGGGGGGGAGRRAAPPALRPREADQARLT